jgi:hypothetical protein
MNHTPQTLLKKLTQHPQPEFIAEHLAGDGCKKCKTGILYAPEIKTSLSLYVRDAILHLADAIVWCDCAMGAGRRAYAERTCAAFKEATFVNGYNGEFVASQYIDEIKDQLNAAPTMRVDVAPDVAQNADIRATAHETPFQRISAREVISAPADAVLTFTPAERAEAALRSIPFEPTDDDIPDEFWED